VNFLDAYALIALLAREPAESEVAEVMKRGAAAMSVVNLAETIDCCVRLQGYPAAEVGDAVRTLVQGGSLALVVADAATGLRAGAIRAEHYHRQTRALSLADCFLLAAAAPGEDTIATADPPVAAAARSLGIELIALPDTTGRRP
jgi:PIN domain nuclease of toxin-antitoxin system